MQFEFLKINPFINLNHCCQLKTFQVKIKILLKIVMGEFLNNFIPSRSWRSTHISVQYPSWLDFIRISQKRLLETFFSKFHVYSCTYLHFLAHANFRTDYWLIDSVETYFFIGTNPLCRCLNEWCNSSEHFGPSENNFLLIVEF